MYFISFATHHFNGASHRIEAQAKSLNLFEKIIIYTPDMIAEFMEKHHSFIQKNSRGYAYWVWKSHIIR